MSRVKSPQEKKELSAVSHDAGETVGAHWTLRSAGRSPPPRIEIAFTRASEPHASFDVVGTRIVSTLLAD